jgi:hypothetical protein
VADRAGRLAGELRRRPRHVDQPLAAEHREFCAHPLPHLAEIIEGQRIAEQVADGTEDRPILTRFARGKSGLLAPLHPAFEIDIGAMLFSVGGGRQHQVGMARAIVPVMADIHLERALEAIRSDLIGAEQKHDLRGGCLDVGDAALPGIAEDDPCHA